MRINFPLKNATKTIIAEAEIKNAIYSMNVFVNQSLKIDTILAVVLGVRLKAKYVIHAAPA